MKIRPILLIPVLSLLYLQTGVVLANTAINQFLAQATESAPSLPLSTADVQVSWFGESDFRYSGNDTDDYSLAVRFQPRFEAEHSAQVRVQELLHRQNAFEVDDALNNALQRRYLVLLDLIEVASELQFQQDLYRVSRDALELNRRLVETEGFNIADLQVAEFDFRSSGTQLKMLQNRLNRLLQSFDKSGVDDIQDFLQHWPEQVDNWEGLSRQSRGLLDSYRNDNLESGADHLTFELAQQKLKLTRSESGSWVKFIELKYDYSPGGDQQTTLGFAIPLGSDDSGISQRAAEVTRSRLRLQSRLSQLLDAIQRNDSELEWYREQEQALMENRDLLEQQFTRLSISGQPLILLKLRGDIVNQEYRVRRNRLRALRGHFDLLHAAGYLARKPLVNWLLRDQPGL